MYITSYGAVREVTGSMHMVSTDFDRVLLDCGLFQGRRKESAEKNRVMPIDPGILTNVVLSHAHIDHSGRIPLLVKKNFKGHVMATRATVDVCKFLLTDSAHIQESDAEYLNYKNARHLLTHQGRTSEGEKISKRESDRIRKILKSGNNKVNREVVTKLARQYSLNEIEPLYSMEDAQFALQFFNGMSYNEPFTIGKNMTCTFYEAGHILGSAISIVKYVHNGQKKTICYTGDLGRFDMPILRNPATQFEEGDQDIDLLIMESTYGDRLHETHGDLRSKLIKELNMAYEKGGSVVIPSFALGRSQELLYVIHELFDKKDVPLMPVYVDSPLASSLTTVFGEHPELYDRETHKTFLEKGKNPFDFQKVKFVSSVEESMELMRDERPHIVISASGMCEVGRILHHLRYKIHNPINTILIVGFMAQHTLGRRILDLSETFEKQGRKGKPPLVKILGKEYPLAARVVKMGGFSAHADRDEMLAFLKRSNLKIKKIAVVHGEETSAFKFADRLGDNGFKAVVPRLGETIRI